MFQLSASGNRFGRGLRYALAWALLLAPTSFLSGCGKRPSEAECRRLLDHYVALLTREEWREAAPEDVARKQFEARRLVDRDPHFEFDRCMAKVNRRQFDCALGAPTVDAVERCLLF